MAVQAQYPSNVFTLNSVQKFAGIKQSHQLPNTKSNREACLDQIQSSPMMIFSTNGNDNVHKNSNCRNQLKRGRDASSGLTTAPVDSFFGFLPQQQQQPPRTVDISQLHNTSNMNNLHPPTQKNLLSSTGLKLSFPDQHQRQQMNPDLNHSLFLSDYINQQMKEQQAEIDRLLHFQGEQLKRVLSDKRQRQYRAILTATEESVVRRLGEKQAEFQKAVRRNAELEARAVQLSMEAHVWQAKARAQESAAESLQSQLQQALISSGRRDADGMEEGQADDAESVHIDPDRIAMADTQNLGPVCKACRRRPASVVLLPCRHLCVCAECDGAVAACPYCFTMKNSSVEVFLS